MYLVGIVELVDVVVVEIGGGRCQFQFVEIVFDYVVGDQELVVEWVGCKFDDLMVMCDCGVFVWCCDGGDFWIVDCEFGWMVICFQFLIEDVVVDGQLVVCFLFGSQVVFVDFVVVVVVFVGEDVVDEVGIVCIVVGGVQCEGFVDGNVDYFFE